MKKIGVVTFWNAKDNYGQILQCFALNCFFRKLGYDAYLIKCGFILKLGLKHKIKKVIKLILSPSKLKESIGFRLLMRKTIQTSKVHSRFFEKFIEENIPSTRYYTAQELFDNPPIFDIYVCGSDQIWSGLSPLAYLRFVPSQKLKVAYAASMGGFYPKGKELDVIKDYLSDFNMISLREKQSVDYLKNQGLKDVFCAPDPTLLLDVKKYQRLYQHKKCNRTPYIFLYLLGNRDDTDINKIYDYAKRKSLNVIYVASQGRVDDYPKEYPTVEEWLMLIEHAEMVVTNSYHGTIFSMIFRKKFTTIFLSGMFSKMNDRVLHILSKYGLENRIFNGQLVDFEECPDYSCFESTLSEEVSAVGKRIHDVFDNQ